MNFFEKVAQRQKEQGTTICLGLDPRPAWLTEQDEATPNPWFNWGRRMIEQTAEYVCCVKPNIAFYEAGGAFTLEALRRIIEFAHEQELPVLLDAKRGDIGSTADAYARAVYEWLDADAVTVNPYLGADGVMPFLNDETRGVFAICHTSNPSAGEFQTQRISGRTLYEVVAETAPRWSDRVGLVVGATYPEAIERVRRVAADAWLLLPGVGPQGGDPEAAVAAAGHNYIVPSSRGICTADSPADAARELRDMLRDVQTAVRTAQPTRHHYEELILALHRIGAVQFGDFTLASGKSSPIYIDLRLLSSDMDVMAQAAAAYVDVLRDLEFDHIAGIPYAALPVGTAVALQAGVPLIYPRKETKDYGRKRVVEGKFEEGDRALLLDDLITTGGSKVEAAQKLRDAGIVVKDVVVLIDRQVGGDTDLAEHGMRLHAVLTLREVVDVLATRDVISKKRTRNLREYLANR